MSDSMKNAKGTGPPQKAKTTAKTQLVDGLARLFDSSDYSDLSQMRRSFMGSAPRDIMFSLDIFQKRVQRLVSGTFLKQTTTLQLPSANTIPIQEGISHIIELKEDDPTLLRQVLLACYTCSYDEAIGGNDYSNKLDINARIYAMADKYDMPFLKKLAPATFQARLDDDDGHMVTPHFLEAVRTIYTTTLGSDRGLRGLLVPVVKRHRKALVRDAAFLDLIKSGLADGDFALDVIAALSQLQDPEA